jgi:hypothetical protein
MGAVVTRDASAFYSRFEAEVEAMKSAGWAAYVAGFLLEHDWKHSSRFPMVPFEEWPEAAKELLRAQFEEWWRERVR